MPNRQSPAPFTPHDTLDFRAWPPGITEVFCTTGWSNNGSRVHVRIEATFAGHAPVELLGGIRVGRDLWSRLVGPAIRGYCEAKRVRYTAKEVEVQEMTKIKRDTAKYPRWKKHTNTSTRSTADVRSSPR